MNLVFRQAKVQDLDHICTLIKSAIAHMDANHIHQWDEIYPARADFQRDLDQNTLYVGATDTDIAVVFVLNQEYDEDYNPVPWTHPNIPYRVLHRLCVNPAYQNQGIARKTLDFMENLLCSQGIYAIRLDAYDTNPYAIRLYQHFGFVTKGYADWRMGRFQLMEKYLKDAPIS